MVDRRIQAARFSGTREPIAYRLTPVFAPEGPSMATAAIMSSMISNKMISSTGGGGDYITPEEYKAIRTNGQIKEMIRAEANKPVPKIIDVVVSLDRNANHDEVLSALKRQGFELHRRGNLGLMCFFVGEIYDTYLEESKAIDGIEDIQLKEEVGL